MQNKPKSGLTPKQRAIIEDAISQINGGQFIVNMGHIIRFNNLPYPTPNWFGDLPFEANGEEIQNAFQQNTNTCYVCAKGAILVSKIRLFDGVNKQNIECISHTTSGVTTKDGANLLRDFSKTQLAEIETLFERKAYYDWNNKTLGKNRVDDLVIFSDCYLPTDAHDRLLYILAEFLRNKGKKFNLASWKKRLEKQSTQTVDKH